jgi:DNA-binding MarR family transcriptional regulator
MHASTSRSSSSTPAPAQTAAGELAANLLELWRHALGTGHPGAYAIFEELDLSLTQVKALVALSHDELSVKELAERLGLSLPGASRAADALVCRKLVDRREDPGDRRQKRLRCTDAGLEALRRLDEARLAGLSALVATLPAAQCERLSSALRPVLDDLRERS